MRKQQKCNNIPLHTAVKQQGGKGRWETKTMKDEIVLYQPNAEVQLEVQIGEDSVWLTQEQIALLFGTQRPAITKHLNNIYKSGELDIQSTCSILERMGNDG